MRALGPEPKRRGQASSGRHSRLRPAPALKSRPNVIRTVESDFEPPHHVLEPDPADDSVRLQLAACRRRLSAAPSLPPRGSTRVALRRSEDAFVDELFAHVVALGAPLMTARFPRAYLDVNREPYELDPRMFDGRLPPFANTRSMRVAGGLGTIPRIVADGQEIYRGRLRVDEGLRRIEGSTSPITARCASSSTAPRAPSASPC